MFKSVEGIILTSDFVVLLLILNGSQKGISTTSSKPPLIPCIILASSFPCMSLVHTFAFQHVTANYRSQDRLMLRSIESNNFHTTTGWIPLDESPEII